MSHYPKRMDHGLIDINTYDCSCDEIAREALQQPSGPIEDLTDEEADAYYEALQEKP